MNPNPNNLTDEQIKQGYSTIPGAYDPLTGKLKSSNVITPQSLQPQPQIQLPQTPQIVTPTTTVAQPNITETMLKTLESDKTEAQKVQETGISEILKSFSGLDGEAQALATEKDKAGVNILRQDLQGINSQILKKQAELKQDDIQLIANMRGEERRDTLLPFAQMGQAKIAGDAQIVRALKNAEIGVLNATAIAKQGDIALAQQTAEEAVAIKYEPYKDNIRKWENTLKVIEPLLTRDEKKQAEVQKIKGQLAMREIEKAEANEKTIEKMLLDATPNAPANIISNAKAIKDKGGNALEVAQALGKYGGDYLKTELLKQQIETEKAQRSNINANRLKTEKETELIGGGDGGYTEKQLKSLSKLNQDVSKNATYTKTTSMRNYGDNVVASLSLNSGVGDIAAINQFQKVIDEGAVTRDQDVKLIQGSQSLANTLKTKIKKLERGEQLSPELRKQMREAVEAMYNKQVEALQKDPYISAKTKEAELYGLTTEDTILGELGGFTQSNPADNKFGQVVGVQSPPNYTTTNMTVKPDGSLNWTLPTNQPTK